MRKKIEQIKRLAREPGQSRMPGYFPRSRIGQYFLSVQASRFHYSHPREDYYDRLGKYEEVEVAVIGPDGEIDYRFTGYDVGGYWNFKQVERLIRNVQQGRPEFPYGDKHRCGSCSSSPVIDDEED